MMNINNRRYIGSKTKLVDSIYDEITKRIEGKFSFADLFSGTGIVAYKFAKNGHPVVVNDILYSNYISYNAWFSDKNISRLKLERFINGFNNINYNEIDENYFSKIYGNKYFSINDAKKIGYIRDKIEENKDNLNYREYCVLLTALMYKVDKIANTVGHFEHFLKTSPVDSNFILELPHIEKLKNAKIFQMDANDLVKIMYSDVIYIDPPYNARQYVNFYHVLENLITWNKPTEFEGISMKFKRNHLKSGYSKVIATDLFEDLIDNLRSKLIVVSYNNTYNAKSTASNNKISEENIISILTKRGKLSIVELEHKHFNSGKTNFSDHKEKLYICETEGR